MARPLDLEMFLAHTAVGYLKRWMERDVYDRAFETEFGQRLRALSPEGKYSLEAVLNVLGGLLGERLEGAGGFVGVAARELGVDAAPEISRRMLDSPASPRNVAPEPGLAARLLSLPDGQLSALLSWMAALDEEDRKAAFALLSQLDIEILGRLAACEPADRDRLLAVLGEEPAPALDRLGGELAEAARRLRERLEQRRQRGREVDSDG